MFKHFLSLEKNSPNETFNIVKYIEYIFYYKQNKQKHFNMLIYIRLTLFLKSRIDIYRQNKQAYLSSKSLV